MSDTALELADGVYEANTGWFGMVREDIAGLTAASFPVKPPSTWFANPNLRALTPLTVDNSGKVFGHIAAWHTSHIGLAGGVKPPRSKSDYAFFRTGQVETDEGKFINVGQITLTGGHAPLEASVARAVAHYDDTNSAVMDVACGEDRYGIWVAGGLRPSVTEEQIRAIRASSVSGDWRPINGRLELVAICNVNAPGFPIPRARVASGAPIALVAAGTEPLVAMAMADQTQADIDAGIRAGLLVFHDRVNVLEKALVAMGLDASEVIEAAEVTEAAEPVIEPVVEPAVEEAEAPVEVVEGEIRPDVMELRRRVREQEVAQKESTAAELRRRVREPVVASVNSKKFEELRNRVHN